MNESWDTLYPGWDPTTLETTGVLARPDYGYVLVRDTHPVVKIMRHNENVLNVRMDSVPKVNGQWYKVSRPVMEVACETLRAYFVARHPERLCMPPPEGPAG